MTWTGASRRSARLAGTTSRTLRHYDDVGLVPPSRIGSNGYRYYDADALVRLQRVLLLRELGLGIPAIAEVLEGHQDDVHALVTHRDLLRQEQKRLARQLASVEATISTLEGGEQPMAENMFDGFDHTQYKEEVEERWGKDAYAKSDSWWRSMSADEKKAWQQRVSRARVRLDRGGASRHRSGERRGAGARAAALRLAHGHPRNSRWRCGRPELRVPDRPRRDVRRGRPLRGQLRRHGRRGVRARHAPRLRGPQPANRHPRAEEPPKAASRSPADPGIRPVLGCRGRRGRQTA